MNQKKTIYKIGISGSYGGLNLGDEAILQSIIAELRRSLAVEITVFSRNHEDTRRRHRVERAIPVRNFVRNEILPEIERLDLFILGGGGILYDGEAKVYLREVELANELGVPVMLYAIGAGPLQDPTVQKLVRQTLNEAAVITVRERFARHILEEAGVQREILVTADPAFLLKPEPLPKDALQCEGLKGKKRLVGMSVREPGMAAPDIDEKIYHSLLANAADFVVSRFDADVVFVPMEHQVLDVQHSHAVISKMMLAQRAVVLKGEYTAGQLLSLVENFEFVIGMRLHFLIFAALQGVPFVALPYATKVSGILESLGIDLPPMQLVNAGQLLAYIDRFWDLRQKLRDQIQQRIPELQQRALENNRIAVQLLTKAAEWKNLPAQAEERMHAPAFASGQR